MKSTREQFEEIWPVPDGVYWMPLSRSGGEYMADPTIKGDNNRIEAQIAAEEWDARLDTFTRCQEMLAIPEITKDHVFFALNCHMEDPSDDEEDGFNAGVSWCLAFIKQEIAKRNRK